MNATAKQQLRRNVANDPYSNPTKTYSVPSTTNDDGTLNIPAQPVYLVDPQIEPIPVGQLGLRGNGTLSGTGGVGVVQMDGRTYAAGESGLLVGAELLLAAGVTGAMQPLRTPNKFVHALCTTVASTAVWTPAGGKKFRLMGYVIVPSAGMAAAGIQLITLLDEATAITIAHQCYLPIAASVTNQAPIVVQLPGNGYLSVAADNRLSVTLTSACTAGAISVMAYGTEE